MSYGFNEMTPQKLFLKAAQDGDLGKLMDFKNKYNFDVNTTTDKEGNTALIHAVMNGHIIIVSFLIAQGADVRLRNNEKLSAINYAFEKYIKQIHQQDKSNAEGIIVLLLQKSEVKIIDVSILFNDYNSFQQYNDTYSNLIDVIYFIINNSDSTEQKKLIINKLLLLSARDNVLCILESIFERYLSLIDINYKDGFTALGYAVRDNNIDIVRFLLEKDACPFVSCQDNKTSIDIAVESYKTIKGRKEILGEIILHAAIYDKPQILQGINQKLVQVEITNEIEQSIKECIESCIQDKSEDEVKKIYKLISPLTEIFSTIEEKKGCIITYCCNLFYVSSEIEISSLTSISINNMLNQNLHVNC